MARGQRKIQGKANPAPLAHLCGGLKIGGQAWVKQRRGGFPIVEPMKDPGVYRAQVESITTIE